MAFAVIFMSLGTLRTLVLRFSTPPSRLTGRAIGGMLIDMAQPSLFQPTSVSVSDLNRYLRNLLERDEALQDIWVSGEISNLSRPVSGHIYFTLKDSTSALRCVIWKSSALRIRLPLQNGLAIEAHGAVSLYERDGIYQLYIDSVRAAGEGYLYQEFLRLKARLEAEGLFDPERKRPIPTRPQRIGIVTSPTGAALQDMLNTLAKRYPLCEVILAPAAVQGVEAPGELVNALNALNRTAQPDVILLARGGGSLEDLWAFNDETVVRAVANSPTPVICGVGHETDFTLCDFAADLRAPTPTGAAVLATPEIETLWGDLRALAGQLVLSYSSLLEAQRRVLEDAAWRLERASPMHSIQEGRQHLDMLGLALMRNASHALQLRSAHLTGQTARLQALNPLAVLRRGYAVITTADGSLLRSITQAQTGQHIRARLADGSFGAEVRDIQPE